MDRIVVTGPDEAGKTTFARRLALDRADLPLIHFDAPKLATDWVERDRSEIEARLRAAVDGPEWILEGGQSLLAFAMPRSDALVWLDPRTIVRALRLSRRPLGDLGRARPELPDGNPDRLWQQYRFAWRSLAHTAAFPAEVNTWATAPGQVGSGGAAAQPMSAPRPRIWPTGAARPPNHPPSARR